MPRGKPNWFALTVIAAVIALAALAAYVLAMRPKNGAPANANQPAPAGWLNATDKATGLVFSYPPDLAAQYVRTADWPPAVRVVDQAYSCVSAGNANAPAGKTEEREVNGRSYCITQEAGAAAGTTYVQYAYAFAAEGNRTVIMTFSLAWPNCDNYQDPEKAACKSQQAAFDVDALADGMVETFR